MFALKQSLKKNFDSICMECNNIDAYKCLIHFWSVTRSLDYWPHQQSFHVLYILQSSGLQYSVLLVYIHILCSIFGVLHKQQQIRTPQTSHHSLYIFFYFFFVCITFKGDGWIQFSLASNPPPPSPLLLLRYIVVLSLFVCVCVLCRHLANLLRDSRQKVSRDVHYLVTFSFI